MTGLFNVDGVFQWFEHGCGEAARKIDRCPKEEIRFSPEAVIDTVVNEFADGPIGVDFSQMEVVGEIEEMSGHLVGMQVTVRAPYSGRPDLITLRPSTTRGAPARGAEVKDGYVWAILGPLPKPESAKSFIDKFRTDVTDHAGWLNSDIERCRNDMRNFCHDRVMGRKRNLDAAAAATEALAIPVVPKPNEQRTIPVTRKAMRMVDRPTGPTSDPALQEEVYEDIIRTVTAFGRSEARLPKVASRFDEQDQRDMLLFVLNSNYEGSARGEVFNFKGKTDILIPHQDRNAFIAECKIWKGQAAFREALDQLLGYLAWNDTKAAIVLFIKDGNPSEIIKKASAVLNEMCDVARPPAELESRQDFLFSSTVDRSRKIQLAFLPIVVVPPASSTDRSTTPG